MRVRLDADCSRCDPLLLSPLQHAALTWTKCLGIAVDVARGMVYLHAFSPSILHRDLKSLNILVDENWRAKVRRTRKLRRSHESVRPIDSIQLVRVIRLSGRRLRDDEIPGRRNHDAVRVRAHSDRQRSERSARHVTNGRRRDRQRGETSGPAVT
jgi:hypothetical protein